MVKIGLIQMEATPLKVEENLSRTGHYKVHFISLYLLNLNLQKIDGK